MRDVINANLDPHRWFAGVMTKVIKPDLSRANDPQWVKEMTEFLNEHVSKSARQNAKMSNFGLPGLMGKNAFYRHCREEGLKVTKQETDAMRDAWISTFKEMEDHTNPTPAKRQRNIFREQMGMQDDDDEEEFFRDPDNKDRRLYIAECVNGFIRNNASANAACNVQFQALVAYGAKLAGWNLLYHLGMGDRIINFIHDEYLYWLMPDELELWIPRIEREMVAGMRIAIPDVTVKVETSCSYHWDKGAKEFHSLDKDESGNYIITEPDMVRQAYAQLGEQV